MKIAIMGAGLSGLACAIVLERNGIYPDIFEKRRDVGDRFINAELFLSFLTRPINDAYQFFSEEHNIFLKPSSPINQLYIHSENKKAIINEQIGFINLRGRHKNSFEQQLKQQVSSKINYHSTVTYEELLQEYSHVILATGDAGYALNLNNFKVHRSVTLKGATVEGDFMQSSIYIWFDHKIVPNGYAYVVPFSKKEANVVIAYPQISSIEDDEQLWQNFYNIVCSQLKQSLKVTDEFHVKDYLIGRCIYPRIGNTFFTGNCFGALMPFLGFGQFSSLLTGIYAGNDICGYGRYEHLTKSIRKSYNHSLTLRKAIEKTENSTMDKIVSYLDGYLGEKFFKPNNFNSLNTLSYIIRPFMR